MRCFFVFLILSFLFPNYLDGVIAVVGDKAVLKSDVLDQAYMLANQKNISPSDPRFEQVFDAVLKEKVHRLIVLSSAEKDTSIVVSYSEINTELESRIDYFLSSFGSEAANLIGKHVGKKLNLLRSTEIPKNYLGISDREGIFYLRQE